MMHVVERRHDRAMRMREDAVDDVLDESPGEETSGEYERVGEHLL
jgi:hypothetical protein